jgi:hypothetical protein
MSLNVVFDGYVYLNDGSLSSSNVYYQAFFYRNGTASSLDTWNSVRIVESSGYYNCNGGDLDWLSQDGTMLVGSMVIIAFWRGGSRMGTDCSVLDEWGAVQITLDESSTYTNQTQVKANLPPELVWSFPTNGLVGQTYWPTNSSHDVHTWDWMGTTMAHYYIWNSEPIYFVNHVNNSSYYWGDGLEDLNLPGTTTTPHSWTSPGDYTITIVIEDECGATVTGTEVIRIKNSAPSPGIFCNEAVGQSIITPDTVVSFEYDGTNPNNVIYNIDWIIYDDTNTTTSGEVSDTIYHTEGTGTSWYGHSASSGAFTDPGNHTVAIVVYWNDGFENHTINYSEVFTQEYFSGPTVDFTQVPNPVAVTSGVEFNNTTSDPDNRVGTGFTPIDGAEYYWTWNDEGNIDTVSNVDYSYVYSNTANSDDITIQLCANWNDGWDDHETCELKNVAIETTVVVVQEDCYYELTIFGTSDDGTVTGYHWEISRSTTSGIAGPYELIWTSPTDMTQKEKTIAFSEQNYFEIKGFVHGNGDTEDYEIIYIDTVCPGEECTLIIWNGTGIWDAGGDWTHSGFGTEASYAKYEGTNGLDATSFISSSKIRFTNTLEVNVDGYDLLSMYVNLKEWQSGTNISVYFEDGNVLYLNNYFTTYNLDTWQRVFIPLEDFGLTAPINLRQLTIESAGNHGFYLDNVEFVVGATLRTLVDVGKPYMEAEATNVPSMKATAPDYTTVPSMLVTRIPATVSPDTKAVELDGTTAPDMKASSTDLRPKMSAFPPPSNL